MLKIIEKRFCQWRDVPRFPSEDSLITPTLPISFSLPTSYVTILNSYGLKQEAQLVCAYTGTYGSTYQTENTISFWDGAYCIGRHFICIGF